MLRPVAYWQDFPQHGDVVATIWGAGNPLTWWAVVPAITISAVRAMELPSASRLFMVFGFLAYFLIWIPIGRILFLYHYMPAVYVGYLALAAVLADMWNGGAEHWESFALLLTTLPLFLIGTGHVASEYRLISANRQIMAGMPLALAMVVVFLLLVFRQRRAGRFVFVTFLGLTVVVFVYYLPIWLGMPITRTGYYARMWLQGPGLRNWI